MVGHRVREMRFHPKPCLRGNASQSEYAFGQFKNSFDKI